MEGAAYEGRETMRIVPNVGPEARVRVRRAQALNDEIDWTVDPEDERRALAMWRPLARQYPEDLAVMHGYVLALARCSGEERSIRLVAEFRSAALRLYSMDAVRPDAAAFAGSAQARWARLTGEPSAWEGSLAASVEWARRAEDAHERASALHDQAMALSALGRTDEALARTEEAMRLDPQSWHRRFDRREEWDF